MANRYQNNVSCFDDPRSLSSIYNKEVISVIVDEEFPKDEKNNDSSKIHQGTKTKRIPYPAGPIITIKKTRSMKLLATRDTA